MKTETNRNSTTYIYCMITLTVGIIIGRLLPSNNTTVNEHTYLKDLVNQTDSIQSPDSYFINDTVYLEDDFKEKSNESIDAVHAVRSIITSQANDHADSRSNYWAENLSGDYANKLTELGIPEEVIPEILEHRLQLVELSSIDKVFRQRMQSERFKHLEKIKNNTTPAQYEAFVEYERLKAPERELKKMSQNGFPSVASLNQEDSVILKTVLADNDILTTEGWDGPLDPLPNPLVGVERVAKNKLSRLDRLSNNLPNLINDLKNIGFDEHVVNDVNAYYNNQIIGIQNGYNNLIKNAEKTPEELMAEIKEQSYNYIQETRQQKKVSNRVQSQFESVTNNSSIP